LDFLPVAFSIAFRFEGDADATSGWVEENGTKNSKVGGDLFASRFGGGGDREGVECLVVIAFEGLGEVLERRTTFL
jgi:hypothetical protein